MAEYIKKATRKAAHGADPELTQRVSTLLKEVADGGEVAIRRMSTEFDKWSPAQFHQTLHQHHHGQCVKLAVSQQGLLDAFAFKRA